MKKFLNYAPLVSALLFLITLPLNMRIVFNFEEIRQIEGFRENVSISLFSFDIILLLLLIFSLPPLLKFRKFNYTLSNAKNFFKNPLNPLNLLILWFLISLLFAVNFQIAFYVTMRLLIAIIAFSLLYKVLNSKREFFVFASFALFVSGFVQSVIGIFQFIFQKSIGLKFFGESDIANTIAGVAKFEMAGSKIIRAYGTFPHPNVFAAFLLLSFTAGIWLVLYANFSKKSSFLNIFMPSALSVIIAGIALSYSRSVILIFIVFVLILLFTHKEKGLQIFRQICGHLHIPRMLQSSFGILLIFSLLFVSYNTLSPRICISHCSNDNSINLRLKYLKTACSTIVTHPLQGVGMGNFVTFQKERGVKNIEPWEQQPVHNLYLLITSEIGLIGLTLFLYTVICLGLIFRRGFFRRLHNPFTLCFFGFLALGFIDHYFWTLPQGMLIFWACLAFFHSSVKITKVQKTATIPKNIQS